MSELTKPNAFVFKALIENEFKLCLCPRIDGQWSEKDIVFIKDENAAKMFDDVLDNILFSILFVGYEDDPTGVGGIKLLNTNSRFMRSDKESAQSLYQQGMFFSTVEKGYQQFYEQPETSGKGITSTPSEQESVQ
jgi:hypothetical protein